MAYPDPEKQKQANAEYRESHQLQIEIARLKARNKKLSGEIRDLQERVHALEIGRKEKEITL